MTSTEALYEIMLGGEWTRVRSSWETLKNLRNDLRLGRDYWYCVAHHVDKSTIEFRSSSVNGIRLYA